MGEVLRGLRYVTFYTLSAGEGRFYYSLKILFVSVIKGSCFSSSSSFRLCGKVERLCGVPQS